MAEIQVTTSSSDANPLWIMLRVSPVDTTKTSQWRRWRWDAYQVQWCGNTGVGGERWDDPEWRRQMHDDLLATITEGFKHDNLLTLIVNNP